MLQIVANTNITIVIVKIITVKKFADFVSNFSLSQSLIAPNWCSFATSAYLPYEKKS